MKRRPPVEWQCPNQPRIAWREIRHPTATVRVGGRLYCPPCATFLLDGLKRVKTVRRPVLRRGRRVA